LAVAAARKVVAVLAERPDTPTTAPDEMGVSAKGALVDPGLKA
jgi:hypothetical protein